MNRVQFKPPTGTVPEGVKENDEFELVCSFRVEAGGEVCMTMMGDQQMPGYHQASSDKRDYSEDAKEMADSKPGSEGY